MFVSFSQRKACISTSHVHEQFLSHNQLVHHKSTTLTLDIQSEKRLHRHSASHFSIHASGLYGTSTKGSSGKNLEKVTPSVSPDDCVEVGLILTAHGIKGEVKIAPSTDEPEKRFGRAGSRMWLRTAEMKGLLARQQAPQPLRPVTIESSRAISGGPKGQGTWLVKFREVQDREQAEQLGGFIVMLPESERQAPEDPDEFFTSDLVGCSVLHAVDGRKLGKVLDVFDGTGSYDTMLVEMRSTAEDIQASRTRSCYIPFMKAMVPVVDLEQKMIIVDPPEGLLDLARATPLKKPLPASVIATKLAALKLELEEEEERIKAWKPPVQDAYTSSSDHASPADERQEAVASTDNATSEMAPTSYTGAEKGEELFSSSQDESSSQTQLPNASRQRMRRRILSRKVRPALGR